MVEPAPNTSRFVLHLADQRAWLFTLLDAMSDSTHSNQQLTFTSDLVLRIAESTESDGVEALQIALVIANEISPEVIAATDDDSFREMVNVAKSNWQMLNDRYSAALDEIDSLAATQPCEFSPQHVWSLIRIIKTQTQIIDRLSHSPALAAH